MRDRFVVVCAAWICLVGGGGASPVAPGDEPVTPPVRIDVATGWVPRGAPGTTITLNRVSGTDGDALCMEYDFGQTTSYVIAARPVPITLPDDFTFTFYTRQDSAQRYLEFKLIDDRGNTFMKKWYSLGGVGRWKKVVIHKDELKRAWGPDGDLPLPSNIASIEVVVTGGTGKGHYCFERLHLHSGRVEADRDAKDGHLAGHYSPRWLIPEQGYWTMTGVRHDDNEALIGEDGTLEPMKRGPSFLPLLILDGAVVSRNEAEISQSLAEGVLPVPGVHWQHAGVTMDIDLIVHGEAGASSAYARYRFTNHRDVDVAGKWVLLVQPYQYYPPWQGGGGFSPINRIAVTPDGVVVNDDFLALFTRPPDEVVAHTTHDGHGIGATLIPVEGTLTDTPHAMEDEHGFAAAAIAYHVNLAPGEMRDIYMAYPLYDHQPNLHSGIDESEWAGRYALMREQVVDAWRPLAHRFDVSTPEPGLEDVMRANVAYNLVSQDGAALQPGSRSYDKAWMRDGAIAAIAMLQAGLPEEALAFARWYAPHQLESGEMPPILDTKAEDPLWETKAGLLEYDSQGQFVWLVHQIYRHTGDRAFLAEMFPYVLRTLEFTHALRERRRTEEYRDAPPEKRIFYGLLPESNSHEGYHMKHSYWDDFWAIKGWEDARHLVTEMDREDLLPWIDEELADFRKRVLESIALVGKLKNIQHLPGAAELGDMDPTSSAGAIVYNDLIDYLPPAMRDYTFDQFYQEIAARLVPGASFRLTPYEFRTMAAFLRLGQKDRALAHLRFLLSCRRPGAWQHFAEVVVSNLREGTYIGDMPHTWVGAEAVIAIAHLFVYEQGDQLIVGAGIDPAWLNPGHVPVRLARWSTLFGSFTVEVTREADGSVRMQLDGNATPPGGFVIHTPDDREIGGVEGLAEGSYTLAARTVHYTGTLPATITLRD
jgi:hypothetical protein